MAVPVNVALVGGAHIHTPGFVQKLNERRIKKGDIRLVRVWDHDLNRARRWARELEATVVNDVMDIWRDETVSAVVIASETVRHEDLVCAAAEAGKHLFVEKPLGMGARDAWVMAQAVEKSGIRFQTGYFLRGNPIYLFLRSQVTAGTFGRITRYRQSNCHAGSLKGWFDTEWRWMADLTQAGCGAFGDLGTHALDLMLWMLGDVEKVTACVEIATGRYGDCDEYGEGLLRFRSGTLGSLAAGWVDVAHPVSLLLSGTEGHASVIHNQLYMHSEKIPGADGKTPWTDLPPQWPHAFDLFLDALCGHPGVPLVSVREAAYRSAVMEALYAAARDGTWVTPLAPPR